MLCCPGSPGQVGVIVLMCLSSTVWLRGLPEPRMRCSTPSALLQSSYVEGCDVLAAERTGLGRGVRAGRSARGDTAGARPCRTNGTLAYESLSLCVYVCVTHAGLA